MGHERSLLVLDEGTTSTRAILYAPDGTVLGMAQQELTQYYPAPGHVEHDAREIWEKTLACAREMTTLAGGADRIAAIGVTNQRETVVAWDKLTGEPICRALVWQDRRTEDRCEALRAAGHESAIQSATGLVLDPYFSATKMRWILDNVPEARSLGDRLAFGTVESWLIWKLTGGLHISDATNASRTMLLALAGASWDQGLCDLHGVARGALPEVTDTSGQFGVTMAEILGSPVPVCGMAGDQQAATIGQACLATGQVKATLGTGAFVLASTGYALPQSSHRLLGTVLTQDKGVRRYALEGSVFVAGSLIKWLRDGLGLIGSAVETESLARSVEDNGGVIILPALSGLGAPHWRSDIRAAISGMSFATGRAHIVRAALEAMAHQVHDLRTAYDGDGCPWSSLRIDGGMSSNDWVAQDLADILELTVERPTDVETTALGAAMLAAVGCGLYPDLDAASAMQPGFSTFTSAIARSARDRRLSLWADSLRRHTT
jgi:glycerol kinase